MNKFLVFVSTAVACIALSSAAQSILSLRYPGGIPIRQGSGMSRSMGGTGVAVSDPLSLMSANPAALGFLNQSVFSAHISTGFLTLTDNKAYNNFVNTLPQGFGFGVPIGTFGALGCNMSLASDASLSFKSVTRFDNPLTYTEIRQGILQRGGITTWNVGWGYAYRRIVSAGVSYQRFYLSTDRITLTNYYGVQIVPLVTNPTYTFPYQNTIRDSTSLRFSGNGINVGGQFKYEKLTAGASFEYKLGGLAENRTALFSQQNPKFPYNTSTVTYDLRLPPAFRAGVSYEIAPEWFVASDIGGTVWDMYVNGSTTQVPDRDVAMWYGVGGQYIPAPAILSPKYYEIMRYRAGFRFNQLPYQKSQEWAVTAGVGLPMKSNGAVDVTLEYGQRTDDAFKNYKEDFFSVLFSLNGMHAWSSSKQGY